MQKGPPDMRRGAFFMRGGAELFLREQTDEETDDQGRDRP